MLDQKVAYQVALEQKQKEYSDKIAEVKSEVNAKVAEAYESASVKEAANVKLVKAMEKLQKESDLWKGMSTFLQVDLEKEKLTSLKI